MKNVYGVFTSLLLALFLSSCAPAHIQAGVPACKLVLGVPFYGRGGTPKMTSKDYKDIKEEGEFVIMWDDKAQAPYLADGEGTLMLGFDNPNSLVIK